jgi:predicted Rossmann fold flavoprotein
MEERDIIIVGAGASGMMAAVAAAHSVQDILVLEKKERAGKKMLITGKGRCNITNTKEWNEFSTHVYPSANFFRPAFYAFSNAESIKFFESVGLKTVVERGCRVFPQSGKASDVVDALTGSLSSAGVEVRYNSKVTRIEKEGSMITGVTWLERGVEKRARCKALILATGGLSYPATGSEGDGYKFAMLLGHKVTSLFPSLTALMPKKYDTRLKGLHLKNVEVSLLVSGSEVQREMGELEFTEGGLEGALGFRVSRRAVKALVDKDRVSIVIDLKPALTIEQILKRAEREYNSGNCRTVKEFLYKLLPVQLVLPFIDYWKLDPSLEIGPENEKIIIRISGILKNWKQEIVSYTSYNRAVTTAGGVSVDEIVAKNMRSKLYGNLFFAGEILDLDGDTGGYNLQIAFSTGHLAGQEAAYFIKRFTLGPEG